MNELDIDLSKKSKIIKIRSEKKKLGRFEVSDFFEKIVDSPDFRT